MTEEERQIICDLWQIIDDIDTYGDMAKSDDKLFRSLVERRQKDRWKTGITTDGYGLKLGNAVLQESSRAEPMEFNATPTRGATDAEKAD